MYCIDTSALLHAWRRDYPPDIFGSLWDMLNRLIESRKLIAPDEVLFELERGGDDLYHWAKERDSVFVEPDEEVQQIVKQIVDTYPNFVPQESSDGIWADPYIIALAKVRGLIVVTGEKAVGPGAKNSECMSRSAG
ncbi:MAG TPA: DUF4411 family protein [Paenibacillus sp.]|uniref:DUF4411 family protein n=1 Tax=Paenibacillus sp. TaxID=58172 RepID=UPI002C856CA0|nr:DUF4411 family protein [Paenibacillus sp.]HUC93057.1 DUF4411 family protein [Paenibacillus sp.]